MCVNVTLYGWRKLKLCIGIQKNIYRPDLILDNILKLNIQ